MKTCLALFRTGHGGGVRNGPEHRPYLPYAGRRDLTVETPGGSYPSWIEVSDRDGVATIGGGGGERRRPTHRYRNVTAAWPSAVREPRNMAVEKHCGPWRYRSLAGAARIAKERAGRRVPGHLKTAVRNCFGRVAARRVNYWAGVANGLPFSTT
jgi:hypothetical protein